MDDDALVRHQLFGGAIALDFPARFDDISEHRPVPDSQEVFADPTRDQSIILEVVEHDPAVSDAEAGAHFFADLASVSGAQGAVLTSVTPLRSDAVPGAPAGAYLCLAVGEQAVTKGRSGGLNKILVAMLVVRLPAHASDLLLTLNTPVFIAEDSAAAARAGAGFKAGAGAAPALLAAVAATLRIHDFGLFGGGG